mmetsp:Transcript_26389/g.12407  ORF Transcript_26389/g.12407 Transcript_26389/m.12407 type:complete len:163 (+) Transcript_26389:736-1224(+)
MRPCVYGGIIVAAIAIAKSSFIQIGSSKNCYGMLIVSACEFPIIPICVSDASTKSIIDAAQYYIAGFHYGFGIFILFIFLGNIILVSFHFISLLIFQYGRYFVNSHSQRMKCSSNRQIHAREPVITDSVYALIVSTFFMVFKTLNKVLVNSFFGDIVFYSKS